MSFEKNKRNNQKKKEEQGWVSTKRTRPKSITLIKCCWTDLEVYQQYLNLLHKFWPLNLISNIYRLFHSIIVFFSNWIGTECTTKISPTWQWSNRPSIFWLWRNKWMANCKINFITINLLNQGYNDPQLGANYLESQIKTHVQMPHHIKENFLYPRYGVNHTIYSNVFRSLNRPAASLILENSMQNACTSMNRSWTATNNTN